MSAGYVPPWGKLMQIKQYSPPVTMKQERISLLIHWARNAEFIVPI